MFNKYYEQELNSLKELAVDFSKAHPALAPMLSGPTSDPDVERLLEGVAFLTGQIRQKLDDEFPEFVQELMGLFFPHCLRSIPSCAIMAFGPKGPLNEPAFVPAGTMIDSVPVDETPCAFRTCFDVTVEPFEITGASLDDRPGVRPTIKLEFKVNATTLDKWGPGKIRLYLKGSFSEATRIFFMLLKYVDHVSIGAKGGPAKVLGPDCVRAAGFDENNILLPFPSQSFPGYRMLQEYMTMPQKFFFVDIEGLDSWTQRGAGDEFEIVFSLSKVFNWAPKVDKKSFELFCTPAINLFRHYAQPFTLDHRMFEYWARPADNERNRYQVYSVDDVRGTVRGDPNEKEYTPYEMFHTGLKGRSSYKSALRRSTITRNINTYISVTYPEDVSHLSSETLSIELTCTNGHLPESLNVGDISRPTATSPERLTFGNITPPTVYVPPPIGGEQLWRLLSHLSINYIPMATTDNFKTMLRLYLNIDEEAGTSGDMSNYQANEKRIEGIEYVGTNPANRIISGTMMRGSDIKIKLDQDNFAGPGDFFLFGCMLDRFLGSYSSVNAYTRLEIENSSTGELLQWPARLGEKTLT